MIQTRWCQYYVICSHCNDDPREHLMFIKQGMFPRRCDKCGHIKEYVTYEMVPGSWREEGYPPSESYGEVSINKTETYI